MFDFIVIGIIVINLRLENSTITAGIKLIARELKFIRSLTKTKNLRPIKITRNAINVITIITKFKILAE